MSETAVLTSVAPKPVASAPRLLQRTCACGSHTVAGEECEECRAKSAKLQRARSGFARPDSGDVSPSVGRVLSRSGRGIDPPVERFMSARFGHDFRNVRLHTDDEAAASANDVGALAYTVDRHIVFANAGYQPRTARGLQLLAHELTHVMQQSRQPSPVDQRIRIDPETSPAEIEAQRVATAVVSPGPVGQMPVASSGGLNRGIGWSIIAGVAGALVGGLLGALAGPVGIVAGALAGAALGAGIGHSATNSKVDDKEGTALARIHRLLTRSITDWVVTDREALQALQILHELDLKNPKELFEVAQMMKFSGDWETLRQELPRSMRPSLAYFDNFVLHPDHGYVMTGDRMRVSIDTSGSGRRPLPSATETGEGASAHADRADSEEYDVTDGGIFFPRTGTQVPVVGKSLQQAADLIASSLANPLISYEISVDVTPVKRGIKYLGRGQVAAPETAHSFATTQDKAALARRDKRARFNDRVPYSLAQAGIPQLEIAVTLYHREVDTNLDAYDDPEVLWTWARAEASRRWEKAQQKSPAEEFVAFGEHMLALSATYPADEQQRVRETRNRFGAWLAKHVADPKLATYKPAKIWAEAYVNVFREETEKSVRKSMEVQREKKRDEAFDKAQTKLADVMKYLETRIYPETPTEGIELSEEQISETSGEVVHVGYLITASPAERIIRDKIARDFLHSAMEQLMADPEKFNATTVTVDFWEYMRRNPEQLKALELTTSHPDVEHQEERVDIPAWQTATEVVVGLVPFVGQAVAISEVLGGRDLFNHPLTTTERTIVGVGILLPGIFKALKLGKGAFVASRVVREFGLEGEEAARVYRLYTGLGPGSAGARLFGWGLNEIKAGRAIDDPKVLQQMEAVLRELGMTDKETARALMPAVEKDAETLALDEAKAAKAAKDAVATTEKEAVLAREPVHGGHEIHVTKNGIEICSPEPCPLLGVEYAKELASSKPLKTEFEAIERLRKTDAVAAARRSGALREALSFKRSRATLFDQLPSHATPVHRARVATLLDAAEDAGIYLTDDQLGEISRRLSGTSTTAELEKVLGGLERDLRVAREVSGEIGQSGKQIGGDRVTPAGREATTATRSQPGVASGGKDLPTVTDQWFADRATAPGVRDPRVAQIPRQIADRMRGMNFKNFADFRETFWRMVANDPVLNQGWSTSNLALMRQGRAPFVVGSEAIGGGSNAVYQLDHKLSLQNGGGLYDLDNIQIVSPQFHLDVGE